MSKYYGWSNYETWNANLWIDNDWRLSETIALHTSDLFGSYDDPDDITCHVADYIKNLFLDVAPDIESGFYADIINSAIRTVNWHEIAKHYVDSELSAIEQEFD
jgi:hypothetical protein